jgi:hypothetical protein
MRFFRFTRAILYATFALLSFSNATAASPTDGAQQSASSTSPLITPNFSGDDPSTVRDALAKIPPDSTPHSLTNRVKDLVEEAIPKTFRNPVLTKADLGREFAFVVPVSQGIRYRSKAHVMTVDVGVSDSDYPDTIILKKTVKGPRGRNLVVAAEAKAKGFIQNIDLIELDAVGKRNKTTVHGRFALSPEAFAEGEGDFSIVFVCRLVEPYLTDVRDHSDPTNDEPTDITTRTSTLHAKVDDIWLINKDKGIVLAKGLRLTD